MVIAQSVLTTPIAAALLAALPAAAQRRFITVAGTTSTGQSGLFGHILPTFTAKTGIAVRVVALGTGRTLDVGRRGDVDVVFVHAPKGGGEVCRRGPRRAAV